MMPPGSIERQAFLDEWLDTPYERKRQHCWWLVRLTQRVVFDRPLPDANEIAVHDRRRRALTIANHPERARWHEIEHPVDGAIVLMRANLNEDTHVGTFLQIAEGRVLHTDDPHGVILSSLLELGMFNWTPTYFVPV